MPSIKWFKDGKPIEKVQRPPNFDPYIQKPKKWRLTISGLLHSDEGTYTCLIENKHGNLSLSYFRQSSTQKLCSIFPAPQIMF